ncbi:MAG: DNA-processing protein DprA, partial [Hyphomicrobiaceae bacterium]
VIEAARRSGSLITAHAAAEQGREVMAVPGHPLDPRSEGPNSLLKKPGVTMVTSAADVLEVLAPMRGQGGLGPARGALREVAFDAGAVRHDRPSRSVASGTEGSGPPSAPTPSVPRTVGEAEMSPAEAVMAVLGPSPTTLDEVARATGLAVREVRVALFELALGGRIEQHGGQVVALKETADD